MKIIFPPLFFVTIISGCSQRPIEHLKEQNTIIVKFIIDDSVQSLDDNYHVFFLKNRDTIQAQTNADSIYLPEIQNDKKYDVLFMFRGQKFTFKDLNGFDILPNQKMLWEIGIDNKPFNFLNGFLLHEEYVSGLYSKIEYFRFNPQERGDGIQVVNKY